MFPKYKVRPEEREYSTSYCMRFFVKTYPLARGHGRDKCAKTSGRKKWIERIASEKLHIILEWDQYTRELTPYLAWNGKHTRGSIQIFNWGGGCSQEGIREESYGILKGRCHSWCISKKNLWVFSKIVGKTWWKIDYGHFWRGVVYIFIRNSM